jgi:hypothetical protein
MGTEIFVTLYARTLPPPYQKGVMLRIIWPALLSDVSSWDASILSLLSDRQY